MRKFITIGMLILLVLAFCSTDIFAKHRRSQSYQSPDNFVTLSFFIQPLSFGLKHQVVRNVFLTGNMDYLRSDEDLLFQAGAAYMIPGRFSFSGCTAVAVWKCPVTVVSCIPTSWPARNFCSFLPRSIILWKRKGHRATGSASAFPFD